MPNEPTPDSTMPPSPAAPGQARRLACPALTLAPSGGDGGGGAVALQPDGEIEELAPAAALALLESGPVLVCHTGFLLRRLGSRGAKTRQPLQALDVLELFAFVRPARFCLPTAAGLAAALGLPDPHDAADQAMTLHAAASRLLAELGAPAYPHRRDAAQTAVMMARGGWGWGTMVMSALQGKDTAATAAGDTDNFALAGLDVWNRIADWEDRPPRPAAGHVPVAEDDARARLRELTGPDAEQRPSQADYAAMTAGAFAPRDEAGAPHLILAEAGTGIGKTLGYIAPASLWAEQNKGTVWISTFTKNLQRQLDQELSRLYPDPAEKAAKAVVRKGRENYLCLLNFEDFAKRTVLGGDAAIAGLVARWARYTRDGDMVGGDFPAWLLSSHLTRGGLTDRRGECIYSACSHYKKCYVEKAVRKARHADIVVANHALVMTQGALDKAVAHARKDPANETYARLIFDEGHHLFDAADSAFAAHLSAVETAELRRWLRGAETQRRHRTRGLADRVSDLIEGDTQAEAALDAVLKAAVGLPAPGWMTRLSEGKPQRPAERFFALVRNQIMARASGQAVAYSLETETMPVIDGVLDAAQTFNDLLEDIATPLRHLAGRLKQKLDDEAADLDTSVRVRIEAVVRGLERRAALTIPAWRGMLDSLSGMTPDEFVDWFSLDRIAGRDHDVGMNRNWIDPTVPFSGLVVEPAHGVVITSATLRDRTPDASDGDATPEDSWATAEIRTGAIHLAMPAKRASFPSPFDYGAQARIFVVRDVNRNDPEQIAAAYRELFLAAHGGGLGLFTAINRLAEVHKRLVAPLETAGLPLYAQHVDAMDTGTLIDIFRAEQNACLLGTDAVRDGIDVPGPSLRMIIFDRTPWPRPDILHKVRRSAFGGARYDDMLTRLRLKQAFGRLIRGADDKGVFIMLDSRLPTRLTSAFPRQIEVQRVGLAEALAETTNFLGQNFPPPRSLTATRTAS